MDHHSLSNATCVFPLQVFLLPPFEPRGLSLVLSSALAQSATKKERNPGAALMPHNMGAALATLKKIEQSELVSLSAFLLFGGHRPRE